MKKKVLALISAAALTLLSSMTVLADSPNLLALYLLQGSPRLDTA